MIHKVYKKLGETPLEALERFRSGMTKSDDEKLSYMGRLDPMAEGEILILSGEDNKNNEKYIGLDKEYEATFVFGFSTDTGDLLGLIKPLEDFVIPDPYFVIPDPHYVIPDLIRDPSFIKKSLLSLKQIEFQKFPWFSAKTYKGKKLFDHFKDGNINFERPSKRVEIKEISLAKTKDVSRDDLKKYIFETINLVNGDFRQKEILGKWEEFFIKNSSQEFKTVEVTLRVTSGTYIRGLTENLSKSLGTPVTLMKLKRTKIFLDN